MIMSALAALLTLTASICMGNKRQKSMTGKQDIAVLWKEYTQATQADRPQKMTALLTDIKSLAYAHRSAWDYYRTCGEYVKVESMRNWKLRDTLEAGLREEIGKYDEPLLTMLMKREYEGLPAARLLEYIRSEAPRMQKARNEDVYRNMRIFNESDRLASIMRPFVRNDYEYALWELLPESFTELKGYIGDTYPTRAYAEWKYACAHLPERDGGRYGEMKRLASLYEGHAVSLLPLQYLMAEDFGRLEERHAASEDYLALRDSLKTCEKKRKSYRTGIDADIAAACEGFGDMLEALERKGALVSVKDGECTVALRNLDKIRIRMEKDGKDVYDTLLADPDRSFYAFDTLRFTLPVVDDGEYDLKCLHGLDELGACTYSRYSLSLALSQSPEEQAVYVADYRSGRPVEKVGLMIYKGSRQVAVCEEVEIDGFTSLPEEISARINKNDRSGYYLQAFAKDSGGHQLMSRKVYFSSNENVIDRDCAVRKAHVMTDRSAFNPGDTVRFKAVVFDENPDASMSVAEEGSEAVAKLHDPQGKVLNECKLRLNAYGSADGFFLLDGPARNGIFRIVVHVGKDRIGSSSFRVDEFVLPTFDLVFDESVRICLPGDTIRVSGHVKAYSGHGLASVRLDARIMKDRTLISEKAVPLAPDGRFELEFPADCGRDAFYAGYEIKFRLVDATGETLEFSRYEQVSKHMNLSLRLQNAAEAYVVWPEGEDVHDATAVLAEDTAELMIELMGHNGTVADVPVSYELRDADGLVSKGVQTSGEKFALDFASLPSGIYEFIARVSRTDGYGQPTEAERRMKIIRMRPSDDSIDASVQTMLSVLSEEYPSVAFAAGDGPVWAIFELFSDKGHRLESKMVYLDGKRGEKDSLVKVSYPYKESYPDGVRMNMFYFRNGRSYSWTHVWRRPVKQSPISLEFSRFTDTALPSSKYSIGMKATAGTEVLASVFDASSEKIMKNEWSPVYRKQAEVLPIGLRSVCGVNSNGYDARMGDVSPFSQEPMMLYDSISEEGMNEAVIGYGSRAKKAAQPAEAVPVREDFSTTLAFEPCLYPSSDGSIDFEFKTSDKLSTFVVSLFAHDKEMNTAVLRRDMVVSLPLKVSLVQPKYLHEGDRYVLKASVSNSSDVEVPGVMTLEVYDGVDHKGQEPVLVSSREALVSAGGVADADFEIMVPSSDTLGFKLTFASECIADALFVTVPVFPAEQTLVEAHSAVLLPGMSEEDLLETLRSRFVNVPSAGAEYSELSIMDMLHAALPLVAEPESRDAVSQSETMYINLLAASLRASESYPAASQASVREYVEAAMKAVDKLVSCSDAEGGFAWFEGMEPSPAVTALVLERYAGLRDRGILALVSEEWGEDALDDFDEAITEAVRYLDYSYFCQSRRPLWYGGLSLMQYMAVRSRYAAVPFDAARARKDVGADGWQDFLKSAKELLTPRKDERWTSGALLAKVRVARVLMDLTSSEAGRELAAAWGLKNVSRMRRTIDREVASLKEYAVAHPSGGVYYPNAVLPWRGLLESEAYAHAQLCDLFRDLPEDQELLRIADGIGIWLMLQKETQRWEGDPGFVEAIASVYSSPEEVKQTKVMLLKKRYLKPFEEIKAAGNGMKVSVKYFREAGSEDAEGRRRTLSDGDTLNVGDKIIAEYSLWSEENRSFVRLSVPRAALFRPAQQLSGWNGGWLRPWAYESYRVSPYCYREVKSDRTLYWIDVFPEESSTFEEEYFVTQAGTFITPAAEIECLYAPHYRGNDRGGRTFIAK